MAGIPYARASLSGNQSWYAGDASGTDLLSAAFDEQSYLQNTNSAHDALEEAYRRRIDAIHATTGVRLDNPMIAPPSWNPFAAGNNVVRNYYNDPDARAAFDARLHQLAAENPDPEARQAIGADRPVSADAEAIARESDQRLGELMAAHPGWDRYVWQFAGGGAASLRDPLTIGSFFIGGGLGAEKTVAGRILGQGMRDAAANAALTAAAEPTIQNWRKQVGLDAGFDQAFGDIVGAAAFGGVVGAGARGLGEAAGAILSRSANPRVRAAVAGDPNAGAELMRDIRSTQPPEVRGAIDAADSFVAPDQATLDAMAARRADLLEQRAAAQAQLGELPSVTLPDDEAQISRVADMLAPAPERIRDYEPVAPDRAAQDALIARMREVPEPGPAPASRPVAQFIRSLGGVDPASPLAEELRARGITSQTLPGLYSRRGLRTATPQGIRVTPARRALDNIPIDELPEDIRAQVRDDGNGYADQQGLIDALEAEQTHAGSSLSSLEAERDHWSRQGIDFGNMGDDEIRGRLEQIEDARIRFESAQREIDLEGQGVDFLPPRLTIRAMAENAARDVQRALAGNYPDRVVHAAADLVLNEHEPLADAVDFALGREVGAGEGRAVASSEISELGSTPEPPAGIDDPGKPNAAQVSEGEWSEPSVAELDALDPGELLPTDDGLVTAEQLRADIKKAAMLERVVWACHV